MHFSILSVIINRLCPIFYSNSVNSLTLKLELLWFIFCRWWNEETFIEWTRTDSKLFLLRLAGESLSSFGCTREVGFASTRVWAMDKEFCFTKERQWLGNIAKQRWKERKQTVLYYQLNFNARIFVLQLGQKWFEINSILLLPRRVEVSYSSSRTCRLGKWEQHDIISLQAGWKAVMYHHHHDCHKYPTPHTAHCN